MQLVIHPERSCIVVLQKRWIYPDRMVVLNLKNLLVDSRSSRFKLRNFLRISFVLQFQNILSQQNRYLPVILLPLKSCLINEFYQPLNDREDAIHIESLKLKRLNGIRAFHIDQGSTNMLWHFDLLADLHFVIIVDFYLKVGWCDTPCDSSNNFIKSFQGSYSDSEITCQQQNFVNLAEPWIIFRFVIYYLYHFFVIIYISISEIIINLNIYAIKLCI